MIFTVKMPAGVVAIALCALLFTLAIPAHAAHNANPACTSVKEDIEHFEKILTQMGKPGKAWLLSDDGFSMVLAASPVFKTGHVILSFYNGLGCLMPHPYTGTVRTPVPVSDKIKSYIARSKLYWSNTDKNLLTPVGYAI